MTGRPLAPAAVPPPTVAAWRAWTAERDQAAAAAADAERRFVAAWRERQATRRALRVIERRIP